MEYIKGKTDFKLHNSAVSLGKFDGLHKGHQLLLDRILEWEESGFSSVMFTFMYHPENLFSDKEIQLIYTEEEKRYLLEQRGLDVLVSYPFTQETAAMEPEDFIREVLIGTLDAKKIAVGEDYCFGYKRRGNVEMLRKMSKVYGYELEVFHKLELDGQVVSSTCIRNEIAEGNMEHAAKLLGRPYSILGEVKHGRKIGRTIGFPTTNLIPPEYKILPPNGVYVSETRIDGREYPGITNVGNNPTVGVTPERRVETFLFDFDEDLYGKTIEVFLYAKERDEYHFHSLEELKEQIEKDMAFGRQYFEGK